MKKKPKLNSKVNFVEKLNKIKLKDNTIINRNQQEKDKTFRA